MSVSNWHVCRTAQRESAEPESPAPTILRPDLAGYSKEPTRVRSQPTCDSFSGDTRTRVAFSYNCRSLLVVAREQRRPSGDVAAICVATVAGVGSAPAAAVTIAAAVVAREQRRPSGDVAAICVATVAGVGSAPAAAVAIAAAVVRLIPAPSGSGSCRSARRGGCSDACAVSQSSVSISGAPILPTRNPGDAHGSPWATDTCLCAIYRRRDALFRGPAEGEQR